MPQQTPNPNNDGPGRQDGTYLAIALMLLFGSLILISFLQPESQAAPEISYSRMKELIRSGEVTEALIEEHAITVTLGGEGGETRRAVVPAQGDPELLPLLEEQQVEVAARAPTGTSMFAYILPWILILAFYFWMQRRMLSNYGGGLGPSGLGGLFSGRFSTPTEKRTRVTFEDVAGQDQAKKEVAELVEFLREPERFQKVGAAL